MKFLSFVFNRPPFIALLLLCAVFTSPPAWAAQPQDGWRALIKEMIINYPGLEAQRRLIQSIGETPDAYMAWADPVIGVGFVNLPVDFLDFQRDMMTQKIVGVTQSIPSILKRTAAKELAEKDMEVAEEKLNLMTAELIAELKKAVYEIAYVDAALVILTENESILDEFVRIANAKYATGKGVQANVIQAQVERSKLIDERLKLNEQRRLAVIRLNRILGRDPGGGYSIPAVDIGPPAEILFEREWKTAESHSPFIILNQATLGRSRKLLKKAKGELGVDMTFSAQYGQRDDSPVERDDFLSVKAGFSIPLWRAKKQDKFIASARFGVGEASSLLDDTVEKVKTVLGQAVTSAKKEFETSHLYKTGIIPQARQALAAARAAYQIDLLDFLTMLSNELTLLQYELEYERSILRLRNLTAVIEAMTGAALISGGANE